MKRAVSLIRPIGPTAQDALTAVKVAPVVVLYMLCVVIPIGFSLGSLRLSSLRVMLLILIIPMVIKLISGKYGKLLFTDILFLLHVVWMTVALGVNNPDKVIEQVGSVGMEFLGGYVIGRAYIRTPADFAALCKFLVLIVMCMMPFALFETLTGRPIIAELISKLPVVDSVANVNPEKRMGLERVQLTFAHPIHFGLFCSVALSLALVAQKGLVSGARRYLTGFITGAAGFLALSSGALTAIAIQLALIGWAAMFQAVKQRWWILVGLFTIAYISIDLASNRTPLKVFMTYATFSAHNAYWRTIIFEWGMINVWANPIFGLGLNDWIRPSYMYSGSMDNFWLVMAVRYGIPGFLLISVGFGFAIFKIMRRNFEADNRLALFRRAWVFTFLGLTFTLCTVHVWTNIYSFTFFMFGAGMWLIDTQPSTQQHNNDDTPEPVATSPYRRAPHTASPHSGERAGASYSRYSSLTKRQLTRNQEK